MQLRNWTGVDIAYGHVQLLSLGSNHLVGTIPPEIGNLTGLERMYLNDNQLNGNIAIQMALLASIKTLQLYGNQLSGTIPDPLGNLSNLQELYLSKNQLTGSTLTTWEI